MSLVLYTPEKQTEYGGFDESQYKSRTSPRPIPTKDLISQQKTAQTWFNSTCYPLANLQIKFAHPHHPHRLFSLTQSLGLFQETLLLIIHPGFFSSLQSQKTRPSPYSVISHPKHPGSLLQQSLHGVRPNPSSLGGLLHLYLPQTRLGLAR